MNRIFAARWCFKASKPSGVGERLNKYTAGFLFFVGDPVCQSTSTEPTYPLVAGRIFHSMAEYFQNCQKTDSSLHKYIMCCLVCFFSWQDHVESCRINRHFFDDEMGGGLCKFLDHLSFSHVRYPYLYLQVHLLDQVKRAASLSVCLSLVAELCSSIPRFSSLVVAEDSGKPVSAGDSPRHSTTTWRRTTEGCRQEDHMAEECP